MAECICSSKKHGHGDVCRRPTSGQNDFCDECEQKMILDRVAEAEPNRTPTPTVPAED
jgi:hypothetical protein